VHPLLAPTANPIAAWSGGIASAILIGGFAGLTPAVRASRMPPTVALRTA
jgi:putative ABC transport system permease protein